MGAASGSNGFGGIRRTLLKQQPQELIRLIGELYRLSRENRRFLEARLCAPAKQLPLYRQLVADCVFPDPLRKGSKVRIIEAKRAISQYQRATGDVEGTVDLMLTFVEQGTAFAADLGYGDETFFASLERMLLSALAILRQGMGEFRRTTVPRLIGLSRAARDLGWGYGDFVVEQIAKFQPDR